MRKTRFTSLLTSSIIVLLIFILCITTAVAQSSIDPSDYRVISDYNALLRDPEKNNKQRFQFFGKVLQVIESEEYTFLRVGTSDSYYDFVYYVAYKTGSINPRILEDDFVTVYGVSMGNKTYTAVSGKQITLPFI